MMTLPIGFLLNWITLPRGSVSLLTSSSHASGVLRAYVPAPLWIVWPSDRVDR